MKFSIKKILGIQKYNKSDRIYYYIILFIRINLLISIVSSILYYSWIILFVSIIVFILTFIPLLFQKRYKINLPIEIELITVLFIYATLFLGEVHGYYTLFWWWDLLLHTGSALTLGFIGFTIMFILYKGNKVSASPIIIAIFSFSFALSIGAVWEIFEFTLDNLLGLNMQKTGLVDTMWDLIVDSIGALIASTFGYLYLKKDKIFLFGFGNIIRKFQKLNPKLFNILKK